MNYSIISQNYFSNIFIGKFWNHTAGFWKMIKAFYSL